MNVNDSTTPIIESGKIKRFNRERGFGYIERSPKCDIWFHYTELKDYTIAPPLVGEEVMFEEGKNQKGDPIAKGVKRLWHEPNHKTFGMVIKMKKREDSVYGFIQIEGGDSVYFQLTSYSGWNLQVGDYVNVRSITKNELSYVSNWFCSRGIEILIGTISSWDNGSGIGRIKPANQDQELLFKKDNYVELEKGDYPKIGQHVTFLRDQTNSATLVKKEKYKLRYFASLGDEAEMIQQLKNKTLQDEVWSFKSDSIPNRILWNYLFYTFERLQEEDKEQSNGQKKILEAEKDGKKIAVFNTGLLHRIKRDKFIFAIFEENLPLTMGKPSWRFAGFCTPGETINNINYFGKFIAREPMRADYFKKPESLLYNPLKDIDLDDEHLVKRIHRFPPKVKEEICTRYQRKYGVVMPQQITDATDDTTRSNAISVLKEYLSPALDRAKIRIQLNYRVAVPQYFNSDNQLLLPLCIDNENRVDAAIAVKNEGERYLGKTILSRDQAYNNARLIARPETDWLRPQEIETSSEHDDANPL